MPIQVHDIETFPFSENTYIVWQDDRDDCFVVDPGFEPTAVLDFLREEKLTVAAILNTHGHVDHIAGNAELKAAYPTAPLMIGHGDAPMLTDPKLNLSAGHGFDVISPTADRLLSDGEKLTIAGIEIEVRDLPGHSPGHVVFVIQQESPNIVMGGDVLFQGSIGRVDFPGGSFEVLHAGIKKHLWPLPDETIVYPGHGDSTTIGEEKRTNPYVGAV